MIAEANAAKGSMYHHFRNKQGLVAAYLQGQVEEWKRKSEAADVPALGPSERVALLFSAVENDIINGAFHGCPFTNAMVEQPQDSSIRAIVAEYRRTVAAHLSHLLGTDSEDPIVSEIMVLYDGAITSAKQTRDGTLVRLASTMAQQLIHQWLTPPHQG